MEIEVVHRGWQCETNNTHLTNMAWAYSRPDSDGTEDGLLELDASINEIPSVVVAIKSTALEREIITSMRDHVIWSRTSRVDDVTKFTVPGCFAQYMDEYIEIQERMIRAKADGVPQDTFRLMLPVVYETEYMARVSMRALHKLYHEFDAIAKAALSIEVSLMFAEAASKFDLILLEMGINHGNCKYHDLLPSGNNGWDHVGRLDSIVSAMLMMPFSLRTQIARHRELTIQDNLREICLRVDVGIFNLSDDISVAMSGTIETWDHVLSKRSCWMADQGLWAKLSMMVSHKLDFPVTLPCADGTCPFAVDAQARFTDADPGSPCPEYMRIHKITASAAQKSAMHKTAIDEGRNLSWIEKINDLEGK